MLIHLRMLMSIFSFMTLMSDGDSDESGDPPKGDDDQKPELPTDKSAWTVEQWEAEMQRVAKKEKTEGRKAAEKQYTDQKSKEQADREREKQEAEGKYDEAKQSLTTERDSAFTERDGLKAQNDELLLLVKADVDSQWDGLPEEVKATYAGEDGDILAKRRHMHLMKPVIDRLVKTSGTPGLRQGPTPRGDDFNKDEEIAKARSRTGLRF